MVIYSVAYVSGVHKGAKSLNPCTTHLNEWMNKIFIDQNKHQKTINNSTMYTDSIYH